MWFSFRQHFVWLNNVGENTSFVLLPHHHGYVRSLLLLCVLWGVFCRSTVDATFLLPAHSLSSHNVFLGGIVWETKISFRCCAQFSPIEVVLVGEVLQCLLIRWSFLGQREVSLSYYVDVRKGRLIQMSWKLEKVKNLVKEYCRFRREGNLGGSKNDLIFGRNGLPRETLKRVLNSTNLRRKFFHKLTLQSRIRLYHCCCLGSVLGASSQPASSRSYSSYSFVVSQSVSQCNGGVETGDSSLPNLSEIRLFARQRKSREKEL